MLRFTDKLSNHIPLGALPKRIISLVPSQTELLYDFWLKDEVIGITKFCVHPKEWFKTKTRVGGTKTVNIQKVLSLNPDLIIANKEENIKEQIEELMQRVPLYVSDISTLEDALQMIIEVGQLVGRAEKAKDIISQIQLQFDKLTTCGSDYLLIDAQQPNVNSIANQPYESKKLKTAYLIWKDPYMAAGGDTFIHHMLSLCGFQNVFETIARYPQIEISQLAAFNCQLLLLSSEPYPFKQKHLDELQLQLPQIKIVLVDGEMFSWYGSRLLLAPEYFCKLIAHLQR